MGSLVLVLGGVRSGKSRFAEKMASTHESVAYLATAQAGDAEMAERIRRHHKRRPEHWRTVECPWNVPEAITEQGDRDCLVLECVPLWLTNLLLGVPGQVGLDNGAIATLVER